MKYVKCLFLFLTKNSVFCLLLMWFSMLLIFSTIMQKEINIDSVYNKYIFSNFIWISDLIPIPGGKIILLLIFLSLLTKIILEKLNYKKFGTTLIHFGIFILLFGGIISAFFSKEGSMELIIEKDLDSFVVKNKFKINITSFKINKSIEAKKGIYKLDNINLEIISIFNNINLKIKKKLNNLNQKNFLDFFDIKEIPMFIEKEKNNAAILINIFDNNKKKKFYLTSDVDIVFDKYKLSLNNLKEKLPFTIKLIKAEKTNYINSKQTKSYKSKIMIKDQNIEWLYDIEMNKPLKYKNFTFYQTGFIEDNSGNKIILTVSKDHGKIFPYISCFIIFVGFVIHILKLRLKNNYEI